MMDMLQRYILFFYEYKGICLIQQIIREKELKSEM